MISKSSQNLMCTFYWNGGTLLLLIRSKDFFTTLLCLSVIFFQCPRPSPDLTSRETDLQRLTYSGFLTAWLPGARNYPPLFLSCIPHGRTKHLEWRHTSGNYRRSQSWARKALTVNYESPEAQWGQPVLKTPEGPIDGGDTHKIVGFSLRSSTRPSH